MSDYSIDSKLPLPMKRLLASFEKSSIPWRGGGLLDMTSN